MLEYFFSFIQIISYFFALICSFFALCIVCDEHLIPTIEVFIIQFQIPEEVAAVTLVAFGSAAPELFLNTISAITKTSDLSLSAVLGSGIIAFGLIPTLCILSLGKNYTKLKLYPLMRESCFYLLGLVLFISAIYDSYITTTEALLIVLVYVGYAATVTIVYLRNKSYELELLKKNQFNINDGNHMYEIRTEDSVTSMKIISPTISSKRPMMNNVLNNHNNSSNNVLNTSNILSNISLCITFVYNMFSTISPTLLSSTHSELIESENEITTTGITFDSHQPHSIQRFWSVLNIIYMPIQYIFLKFIPELHPQYLNNNPENNLSESIHVNNILDNNNNHHPNNNSDTSNNSSINSSSINNSCIENDIKMIPKVSFIRAITIFMISIGFIGILSTSIVSFSEQIINTLGINASTLGATIVALGSEIPDTVSALALARNGYIDGAIAGAIGSQVINITLGAGLPVLILCLTNTSGTLSIPDAQANSLLFLACLLFILVLNYVLITIPIYSLLCTREWLEFSLITKSGMLFQIFIWLLIYTAFLYEN